MHTAVSVGDALGNLRQGRLLSAMRHLGKRSNFLSLQTLVQEWSTLKKLAKTHGQDTLVQGVGNRDNLNFKLSEKSPTSKSKGEMGWLTICFFAYCN